MNIKRILTFFTSFLVIAAFYFQVSIITGNRDTQLMNNSLEPDSEYLAISISGEVNIPGTYEVESGNTISYLVYTYAGGFTDSANITCINLSEIIESATDIIIPEYGDQSCEIESSGNGLININTASQDLLETLPGIGPSTASKIINYRDTNGMFKTAYEITNVSGIGNSTYENIKNYITV